MKTDVKYNTPIVPVQVRLELSNKCVASCIPCHRHLMKRELGFMAFALVEKCLADICSFPAPLTEVVPTGWGECFLHPRWHEILMLIARKLPRTHMTIPTNGVLLTDGVVEKLAQVPTLKLVNFSVNAFLPATYEAYTGLPAAKMEVIEQAAVKLRQLRPDIAQWFSLVRDSRYQSPKEVELFQAKWSRYGQVQVSQAEYAGWPGREPITPVSLPCRSLWSDMAVSWDGVVSSCCYDAQVELKIGDSNTQNLLDIFHGKTFTELRKAHLEGERETIPLCRSCTFA